MKVRYYILLLSGLLCCGLPARAQGGTEALPFLRTDRDPVSAALGGAGVAAPGAFAALRNTAAVPFAPANAAAVSYGHWDLLRTHTFSAGGTYRFGSRFALAAAAVYEADPAYDIYDGLGAVVGGYTPGNMLFGVGAAWRPFDFLGFGANVKYARQAIAEDSVFGGVAFDLSVSGRVGGLDLAAGVSSLGPRVKAGRYTYRLPASATFGAAYTHVFGTDHALTARADLDWYFSRNLTAAGGLEYGWRETVYVRGGYHYGSAYAAVPSYASAGLGVRWEGYGFDVAWLFSRNPFIANTLTAGLSFRF